MRGKVRQIRDLFFQIRITPAYAGKSFSVEAATSENRDHPRLCGEKVELLQSRRRYAGSPPPMRGKALRPFFRKPCLWITPAYAGKSRAIKSIFSNHGDHPRLCGEKAASRYKPSKSRGSPPPMRGKVAPFTRTRKHVRITPAYAGKSAQNASL